MIVNCRCNCMSSLAVEGVTTELDYKLHKYLPDQLFAHFGGRIGWRMFINGQESLATEPIDILNELTAPERAGPVEVEITDWYRGGFLMFVSDDDNHSHVDGVPRGGGEQLFYHSKSPGHANEWYCFQCTQAEYEVPMRELISRDEAMQIVREFVTYGTVSRLERRTESYPVR